MIIFNVPFRKLLFTMLLITVAYTVCAQNVFPAFTGDDSDTLTWKDQQGAHLLLLQQHDIIPGKEEGTASQYISATHWIKKGKYLKEIWDFEDGVRDCPVDIEAKFLAAPNFSDFNKDGISEIWLISQTACKGDVSPSTIKVTLFDERGTVCQLEGEQKLIFPDGNEEWGNYMFDKYFMELEQEYRDFALELLQSYYLERW